MTTDLIKKMEANTVTKHEELIDEVDKILRSYDPYFDPNHDTVHEILSTILTALQEPTREMQLVASKNWGLRTWAEYQEVLAASPLAK